MITYCSKYNIHLSEHFASRLNLFRNFNYKSSIIPLTRLTVFAWWCYWTFTSCFKAFSFAESTIFAQESNTQCLPLKKILLDLARLKVVYTYYNLCHQLLYRCMSSNAIHILNHNSVIQVINCPKFSHKDTLHGEFCESFKQLRFGNSSLHDIRFNLPQKWNPVICERYPL